jgi:hypothetical protein
MHAVMMRKKGFGFAQTENLFQSSSLQHIGASGVVLASDGSAIVICKAQNIYQIKSYEYSMYVRFTTAAAA